MGEKFFTSKEAAKSVGCSLRQLQYWREKEVVVPTIGGTGTGRSIYYSQSDVVQLAIMEYLLAVGLSFSEASRGLKELIKVDPTYADFSSKKRWMFCWDKEKRSLFLREFEPGEALRLLQQGEAVIPVYLGEIHDSISKRIFHIKRN